MDNNIDQREIRRLLAYYIHTLRLMRGFTQQDVSNRVGKSVNAVSSWELGNTSPPVSDIIELCKMFDVTPNQIFGWDHCPELDEYIRKSEDAAQRIEELKKQKQELDAQIRIYSELLNRKN